MEQKTERKKWREKIKARKKRGTRVPGVPPSLPRFLLFLPTLTVQTCYNHSSSSSSSLPPTPTTFSTALFYLFSSSSSFSWLKHKTSCNPRDPGLSGGEGRDGRQRKGRGRRRRSESDVKRKRKGGRRGDGCANIHCAPQLVALVISASARVVLRTSKDPNYVANANFPTIRNWTII